MITDIGYPTYVKSLREFSDPTRGEGVEIIYGGQELALRAVMSTFQQQGISVDLRHSGVTWELMVLYESRSQYDGSTEEPVEEWEVDQNIQEVDLFTTGKAWQAINAEKDTGETVEDVIANILAAVDERDQAERKSKEDLFGDETSRPDTWKLYHLRRAGVDSQPQAQPLVRQSRVVSYEYAQPFVIDPSPNAYVAATFYAAFSVPAIIQAKLPSQALLNTLDKPENTTWAWFQHAQTATTELRTRKVREVREWVLGAVSTILYDIT